MIKPSNDLCIRTLLRGRSTDKDEIRRTADGLENDGEESRNRQVSNPIQRLRGKWEISGQRNGENFSPTTPSPHLANRCQSVLGVHGHDLRDQKAFDVSNANGE